MAERARENPVAVRSPWADTSFSDLTARIEKCIEGLNEFVSCRLDSSRSSHGDALVSAIKRLVGCDAASIFLSGDNPNCLDFAAGVGYTGPYADTKYYVSGADSFLTVHVWKTRHTVNQSRVELNSPGNRIPFSNRCERFIKQERFVNILAVPIAVHQGRCLGVLKLENKGSNNSERFPPEDQVFAAVLASMIAQGCAHRRYARLWCEGAQLHLEKSALPTYVRKVTKILRENLGAECASMFLKDTGADDGQNLRYVGGVGYRPGYQDHVYSFGKKPQSFTAYVASQGVPLRFREAELIQHDAIPYTGACLSWIESGVFRDVLAVPLMDEGECLGVLKLENKLPESETFDELDERECVTFVERLVVPSLLRFSSRSGSLRRTTKGYHLLVEKLGPVGALNRKSLVEKYEKIQQLRQNHLRDIYVADCIAYLGVSRATYYRLAKQF